MTERRITLLQQFRPKYDFFDRMFLHDCIEKYVRCEGLVVDMGAGRKEFYHHLIQGYDGFLTLDIVEDNQPDIVGGIELLPFRENTIDTILLFNVLEHIYEYRSALKELHRCLKKGGHLYGIVPFMVNVHGDPYDYHRYTPLALHKELSDHNFQQVQTIELYGSSLLIAQCMSNYPVFWRFKRPLFWLCNSLNNYIIKLSDNHPLARLNKKFILAIFFLASK